MSKSEIYEAKTEELIQPLVDARGFELVDVEFVKEAGEWYLRVYIDKEGGISVNDCEDISREFNEILDREDYIDEQYIFEVSSPGLTRPLKKEKDYARSIGKLVDVKLYKPADGTKAYTGKLAGYDKNTVTLEDEAGASFEIDRTNIAKISLAFCD
jgi:ribosome maturation factor RimP